MLWMPRPADGSAAADVTDMVPISVSDSDGTRFDVTVKAVGATTQELLRYGEGMSLGVIGPLGNSFRFESGRRSLVVGGGMGVAPLLFVLKEAKREGQRVTAVLGARTVTGLVFERELEREADDLVIVTDDGTRGAKGMITEFLERDSFLDGFERVYCCGPELMMAKVLEIVAARGIQGQFSLERYMYCGSGGCGSCTIDGRRVCKDGPVFDSAELLEMPSFGRRTRTREGTPVDVEEEACSRE
jgi:dihydroorotate dehydrogenase electron transfer subunit